MLTRSGLGLAVSSVILVACGWWWGYEELVVAAAAAAVALVIAVASARAGVRTEVDRTIAQPRVARGEPVRAVYRITNPTRRRSAPMVLYDRLTATDPTADATTDPTADTVRHLFDDRRRNPLDTTILSSHVPTTTTSDDDDDGSDDDGGDRRRRWRHRARARRPVTRADVPVWTTGDTAVRIELPPVDGRDRDERLGLIGTARRGVFRVGPWAIERSDPFGLAVGRRTGRQTSIVVVHPRIHPLHGPYGAMYTVEEDAAVRTPMSDPLSGFVSLREYVDGDDPRLIHWPTSARMGTLMLKEHVERRRPEFTVVLDCAEQVADPDDFEEMVDVVASVAVHALRSGVNVSVKTTSRHHPGEVRPVVRETRVLDLLTPVGQVGDRHQMSLVEVFHAGVDHRVVVLVTGPNGPSSTFVRSNAIGIVRVGHDAAAGPGILLAVDDAAQFAERWRPSW